MWAKLETGDYDFAMQYLEENSPLTCPIYGNVYAAGLEYKPLAMRSGVFYVYKDEGEIKGIIAGFNDGNVMFHISCEEANEDALDIMKGYAFHSVWGLKGKMPQSFEISRIAGAEFDSRILDVMVLKEPITESFCKECKDIRIDKRFLITPFINFIKKCLWEGFGFKSNSLDIRKRIRERTELEPYWFLSKDNEFVAQAHIQAMTPSHGYIGGVCTPREFRRKGYAKEVVARACDYIFKMGRLPALSVSASNVPAHAMYESLGFETIGSMTVYMKEREFKGDENS